MCELGYETASAEMRQRLKSILSDAGFRTFVAEIDDQVYGDDRHADARQP